MSTKTYRAAWAKIGNSSGYRLPSDFFKENPEFAGTDGLVQVIAPDTVVFSLVKTEEDVQAEDELMLSLYLDFLTKKALAESGELEAYTQQMAVEDAELTAGVIIDDD